jgi:hypothetical protein
MLKSRIFVDDIGRVVLCDEALVAIESSFEIAAGMGTMNGTCNGNNNGCINQINCSGSSNAACSNYNRCDNVSGVD